MYEHVLSPLQINGVTLRNRVVRAAHHTALPWSDSPDDLIAYHAARAKGGVAMSILQTGGVHLSSPTVIPVYEDSVAAGYEKLVAAIAPHGMRLFQQLQHQGSARATHPLGGPPWSASAVPNPMVGVVPVPMTLGQIDDVVEAFASAAGRAKRGGIDGVEVHGAHGYLIGQFLSPVTNQRDDDYGGSLENRARFARRVLSAIRAEVGPDFPIGMRLVSDEEVPGGLGPDDWREIAQLLEPFVDYFNISLSTYYRFADIALTMEGPLGYEVPKSEIVTKGVSSPTIVTGRIMSLAHADQIIANGQADLVSMVRALIADPDLVRKEQEGLSHQIRPCIGSNQGCMAGAMVRGRLGCVVNAEAADEIRLGRLEQPEKRRRILVVGGGPAGLEVARVAAARGHDVVLHEMTRALGGQALIAASGPGRADVRAVTEWQADELRRLGVEIRLRTIGEPDSIADAEPDVVVVATGAGPRADGFQTARPAHELAGHDLPHVYNVWDLFGFGGRATVGRSAVVYDDTGGFEGLSAAQQLLELGARVTFVTRFQTYGAKVPYPEMTTAAARDRLLQGDISLISDSYLVAIDDRCVEVGLLTCSTTRTVDADTVVFAGINHPNRELFDALQGVPVELHIVGDAAPEQPSGHGLQHAIRAGSLLGRAL